MIWLQWFLCNDFFAMIAMIWLQWFHLMISFNDLIAMISLQRKGIFLDGIFVHLRPGFFSFFRCKNDASTQLLTKLL
jgi:hypothetical protein